MNKEDFRYMLRGKQLLDLTSSELTLLKTVEKRTKGTDRALLLLHGFSSSPAVYRHLIPQLKHYDAIVCPVLPGHAESITAFSQATAANWMEKATQTCGELVSKYQKVDVLGLSLGGVLALNLSHLFPLNHLFLLAPALKLQANITRTTLLAQLLSFAGFQDLRNAAGNIVADLHADIAYRKLPLKVLIEILRFIKNHQWVAPTCATDLFLGKEDQVVSSPQVEALFASLPNVTIHWLPHSAHVLPLDNDVEQIIECINRP